MKKLLKGISRNISLLQLNQKSLKRFYYLLVMFCAIIVFSVAIFSLEIPNKTDSSTSSNVMESDKKAEPISGENIIKSIEGSVFEVVMLKPAGDQLTYEKPLPFDLIPFSIRNDKYYSIGTAFAISGNEFVSAAHVFDFSYDTQYKRRFIRDKNKNVYEIDKIIKFSDNMDFIIFSVKNISSVKGLSINEHFNLNEKVYAVGNAYGEGIIVRDGILTSKTFEEENGLWEWLRFSAAASPGNSGGPLLDKYGKVIGVVLRKSENENLNYAIPMTQIMGSKQNYALSHKKLKYGLPFTKKNKYFTYNYVPVLPKEYNEFRNDMVNHFANYSFYCLEQFHEENKNFLFPNGKNSLSILHSNYSTTFPNIIAEDDDGIWTAFRPSEIKKSEFENNGFLKYGNINGYEYIYLEKPDNISLNDLKENSKLFMDFILKGAILNRQIINTNTRILSLGNELENYEYIDIYKRKWMVRTWHIEFNDTKIVTFSMLVPGGAVVILRMNQTGRVNEETSDLKELANHIYLSYYGTFMQWKEFLKDKKNLPDIFSSINFSYEKGKKIELKTNRLSFIQSDDLQKITDDSDMTLKFGYYKENGKVVWDIKGVSIGENKNNSNYFTIFKYLKPEKGLNDDFFSEWDKMNFNKYPYNNTPFNDKDGNTSILSIHPKYEEKKELKDNPLKYVYVVGVTNEGKLDDLLLKEKFKKVNSIINVIE